MSKSLLNDEQLFALEFLLNSVGSEYPNCEVILRPIITEAGAGASDEPNFVGITSVMPGTPAFTMAAFNASVVPVGTRLYTAAPEKWISPNEACKNVAVGSSRDYICATGHGEVSIYTFRNQEPRKLSQNRVEYHTGWCQQNSLKGVGGVIVACQEVPEWQA